MCYIIHWIQNTMSFLWNLIRECTGNNHFFNHLKNYKLCKVLKLVSKLLIKCNIVLLFTYQIINLIINYCDYETVISIESKVILTQLPSVSFCSKSIHKYNNYSEYIKNFIIDLSHKKYIVSIKTSLTQSGKTCITYKYHKKLRKYSYVLLYFISFDEIKYILLNIHRVDTPSKFKDYIK